MFQMLPESSGRLVALRVSGKLKKENMVSVAPLLQEKIRENGKVDFFCDMTDLHGWSLGGFWAELKFDVKHARDFRRVAVITGKPLHRFRKCTSTLPESTSEPMPIGWRCLRIGMQVPCV